MPTSSSPRAGSTGARVAPRARRVARAALATLTAVTALGLGAGAAWPQEGPTPPPPMDDRGPAGRLLEAPLRIGWQGHRAEWALPDGEPAGLAVLAHGFGRRCAHLRGTTRALMAAGLAVLCIDAIMAQGNPALAEALAAVLAAGLRLPDGRSLPARLVVAGHSAGGAFAAHLGAVLARDAPSRLVGALLFDPVGAGRWAEDLAAVSADGARPVRAIVAPPGPCNRQAAALADLRDVAERARAAGGDGFVGVRLLQGATHLDAEGEDTEAMAASLCGDGLPRPDTVALLRRLAARWAVDMVRRGPGDGRKGMDDGAPLDPGDPALDALRAEGRLQPIG